MEILTPGMDSEALKEKGKELWEQIIKLETEKYDLEEKVKRQDYDVRIFKLNNIVKLRRGSGKDRQGMAPKAKGLKA